MKRKFIIVSLVTLLISSRAFAIDAQFSNAKWEGNHIPQGQQCLKFGGVNPSTPELLITNIPKNTNALSFEYSDRDYKKMDNGGHGIIRLALPTSTNKIVVPQVPGHSFELPDNFTMTSPHLSPAWDKAGAYMPPCSGGKGHAYYVTIKAMQDNKTIASTVLELGKY
ncbi:hypothetical protein [Colwellia ponticola]|uniref:YbhB/YbcL family Raf kinase inhibitor-like protein n=1 Tax=Colwellia ponticola TaxID=2304625 RepID=A0A8H2JMX6_9GAMM|nr:hypothetical protein [Colwellia ponticola]TMM47047.1 hypothetical protein FCS21_04615 [Colwellia ponticola]